MKVAICDDEKACCESVVTILEDYIHERRMSIDYACFESYLPLKERLDEFDVFILDYKMPEINGIEFAKILREKYGEEKAVIFLTCFPEIVYESFEVRTHRFLLKPIDKEKFYEALDSYCKTDTVSKRIIIKTSGGTQIINLNDVLCIEASRKDVYFVKNDERIIYHKTISEMEEKLSNSGFFRCHRSYLVNMKNVKKFDSKSVYFYNGKSVPISPKRIKDFNKEYLRYQNEMILC